MFMNSLLFAISFEKLHNNRHRLYNIDSYNYITQHESNSNKYISLPTSAFTKEYY